LAIDYDKLMAWPVPEVRQQYSARDTMLYALSVGCGADPVDLRQLRYVYERDLQALPTYPVVLGYPGFWLNDEATGVDWVRVVHGEQGLRLHRPIPVVGEVIGRTRVTEIVDKGPGKGALIYQEREVIDAESGALLATLTSTTFCRGDGGFGGPKGLVRPAREMPQRTPDIVCELKTICQAALLYRLNGDYNPLHVDPAVAVAAGYPRPILHGLCTFGVTGHAVLRAVCDYDASRLASIEARFSSPVLPGETIRTEIWVDGHTVAFRAKAVERDALVINNGWVELAAAGPV
jgi:acyl dehydratase